MEIQLSKWQTEVWDDKNRYKAINIGRRGGKTTYAALRSLRFLAEKKNRIVWYVAPTYKQAKGILWEMLQDLTPEKAIAGSNKQDLSITLKNGSYIILKGANKPDSLRGVRIDLCTFDEVAFFDYWDEVWKVVRPTLMDSKSSIDFISTPNGFNHFKNICENNINGTPIFKPENFSYYHYTTYDNPHISKEEIEEAKDQMDPDSFAQEILGEFRKMKGLIYKNFNRSIHMVDLPNFERDPNWTFTRAIDFGFAHKSACIWFAVNLNGSEIYAYDGIYKEGLSSKDLADAITIKDSGKRIVKATADSESPLQIEELRREGASFEPVEKGRDSVRQGIQKVASMLKVRSDTGKPTLMFSKHLFWIADEFEKYRWIEDKQASDHGVVKEVPLKREDDAMDAIRYFAMSYREKSKPTLYRPKKSWAIG